MEDTQCIDGSMQDCSNSIAKTPELLQFCTEASVCGLKHDSKEMSAVIGECQNHL